MAITEVQTLPTSPTTALSDTLLKGFRTTLDQRWKEFDEATMKEARNSPKANLGNWLGIASDEAIRRGRDKDEDFQKAKDAFDIARTTLASLTNDISLKSAIKSPGNLASTIQTLTAYLDKADKAKEHNTVLSQTLADLTSLKAKMTEDTEDRRQAEVAKGAVAASVAAVAAGTTVSSSEAQGMVHEITSGIGGELKKELGPWGMIFKGVKGVPAKEVAVQVKDLAKEYSEKKWMDHPFDKLFAMIKLFFLKLQIGRAGMDLSTDMTPAEMKLAGIKEVKVGGKPVAIEGAKQETEKFLSAKSYDMTSKLLIYGVSREKFDTALGGAVSAVKDATWGLDDIKKKEATMSAAIVTLGLAKVQEKSFGELKSLGENGILSLLEKSKPEEKAAIKLILEMMGKQEGRFDVVFKGQDWKTLPLRSLLSKLYKEEGYDKVETLTDAVRDFDPSKIASISSEIFTKIEKDTGNISGILSSQYESLKSQDVTPTFLGKILSTQRGTQSIDTFRGNMKNEGFTSGEEAFLEKILSSKYLEELQRSMKARFGFTDELISQMGADTISVKDMLELYAITGGNPDVSKLSKGSKGLLFTKMQMYFGAKDANAMGQYLGQLVKDGSEKYPDAIEVGNMIDSTLNYGVYKSTFSGITGGEKLLDGLLGAVGIDTANRFLKTIGIGSSLTGIIWLAIKLTPVGRIASIVAMLLGALGVGTFTAAQASGKK